MNIHLVNHIAATIRRVDGGHTMGAGALAEAIAANLDPLPIDDEVLERAVAALKEDGWEQTQEGPNGVGGLSDEDLASIARTVIRSLTGE